MRRSFHPSFCRNVVSLLLVFVFTNALRAQEFHPTISLTATIPFAKPYLGLTESSSLSLANAETGESTLRRGEIIFFISYPFTFLASFATYSLFGYSLSTLDNHTAFTPDASFYILSALTAAFLSFGIALNDYNAIKAETQYRNGSMTGTMFFSHRF
ncbi:MAG TPA: hypothetical protein PLY93_14865 [Turneriella sp.]|nr:hypothetical protein [Turneriella sp.]